MSLRLGLVPILVLALGLLLVPHAAGSGVLPSPLAAPLGTAFTYQGQLKQGGTPVLGPCDLQFTLFDALTAGTQVGTPQTASAVSMTNGLFTVPLDFGASAFDGSARWLLLAVRCPAGSGSFQALAPRQAMTPAPYALVATTATGAWSKAGNAGTTAGTNFLGTSDNVAVELKVNGQRALRLEPGTTPNMVGGYSGNSVGATGLTVVGATIGGGGATGAGANNRVTNNYGTIGGGYGNQAGDGLGSGGLNPRWATVSGGLSNTASGALATVGGGETNLASGGDATVAGGNGNTASGTKAMVGGGETNSAQNTHATVAGGFGNTAGGMQATVGGGQANSAQNTQDTVAGGHDNIANGVGATVGGGGSNEATALDATVAGGAANHANGSYTAVGGGQSNTANSLGATIPGGINNIASGLYSFAAGQQAQANHQGTFVWGDSTAASVASTGTNQFIVRAGGGIWLGGTSSPAIGAGHFIETSTGAFLTTGGAWTNSSDAALKRDFAPVDGRAILARLAELPLHTWSYRAEDAGNRHMGPTAQDFAAAFAVGEDDRHIATVDADGVALAAIQGLYALVQEQHGQLAVQQEQLQTLDAAATDKDAQLAAQQSDLAALQAQVAQLAARLAAVEQQASH